MNLINDREGCLTKEFPKVIVYVLRSFISDEIVSIGIEKSYYGNSIHLIAVIKSILKRIGGNETESFPYTLDI